MSDDVISDSSLVTHAGSLASISDLISLQGALANSALMKLSDSFKALRDAPAEDTDIETSDSKPLNVSSNYRLQ
jgi:hypothetical protein